MRWLLGHMQRATGGPRLALKLALDAGAVALAVLLAYLIRFERYPTGSFVSQLWVLVVAMPLLRLAVWRVRGVYRQSWRLFGLGEALDFATATAVVTASLVALRIAMPWVVPDITVIPFGVIALEGLFTPAITIGVRVAARLFDEHDAREGRRPKSGRKSKRAVLVGAGRAGRMAARELRNRPDAGYSVVGFLDDDPTRRNQVIEGVKVLGPTSEASQIASKTDAEVLILTMPSARRAQVRAVLERCRQADLPVRTVPGLFELLGGKVEITKIRPVRIEDLLGREVVEVDDAAWGRVVEAFSGKRVMVTGAGGSIGSELCRQLAGLDPESLILFENNENNLFEIDHEIREQLGDRTAACLADVRDADQVRRVFEAHRPQVVFHAAAYKHVPMMESHPAAAIDNNVRGTRRIVEAADEFGVERFLFVSTDKAVNPANVMGGSKRLAEMIVQARAARSKTKFGCVRFGNVLGSRGSVLHTFRRQIENGGPLTVTHPDVTRFFMTIPEAVRLVLQSGAIGEGGEVFLLDMGEPVRILDMARQMLSLAGLTEEDIPIEFIGLRPGEKLYEELLRDEEGAEPSGVQGIFLAKLADVDPSSVGHWVARLEKASDATDADAIRRVLSVVTGYRPETGSGEVPVVEPDDDARVAG